MKSIPLILTLGLAISAPAAAHNILHQDHSDHEHGEECGHAALDHDGHVDYLHDGHIHHAHAGHTDEHMIAVSAQNPSAHQLSGSVTNDDHPHDHDGEEHMSVQHGDHIDYIHDGRLHHPHGDHADDHGPVKLIES